MPTTYPLDLSGNNPSNLIANELHSVSEAHFRDYYFIVPNLSPFFVDNFSLSLTVNGITTLLTEDVDYSFALPYISGTRTTGKAIYGAITLHNLDLNGILSITYQTIGGNYVVDRLFVLNFLVEKAFNPRTTVWDIIPDLPEAFPPTPHYQDYTNFYGQEEVVAELDGIKNAILENATITASQIQQLLTATSSNIGNYVLKTGDVMEGPLVLGNDPIGPMEATTKQYVDSSLVNFDASNKVNKSGDTMTGFLTLYSNPTAVLHAATKHYVDTATIDKLNKTGDIMTGFLSLHSNPADAMHAATKQYVDTLLAPLLLDPVTKTYVDNKFNELREYINEVLVRVTLR